MYTILQLARLICKKYQQTRGIVDIGLKGTVGYV